MLVFVILRDSERDQGARFVQTVLQFDHKEPACAAFRKCGGVDLLRSSVEELKRASD